MELTFVELKKRKIHFITKTPAWKLGHESDKNFQLVRDSENLMVHYFYCDKFTAELEKKQGTTCLVYREKGIHEGFVDYDLFVALVSYQDTLVTMAINIQIDSFTPLSDATWHYLDENWSIDGETEVPFDETLYDFKRTLLELIYELPEVRLYAVTGMLDYKES